ncbi:MAG: hypothetical protein Q8885_02415 [Candidatus Phytoplasma stylosanthis]|nr:hypothetical protein [Candidatus Phytoplasma stylosanthis]
MYNNIEDKSETSSKPKLGVRVLGIEGWVGKLKLLQPFTLVRQKLLRTYINATNKAVITNNDQKSKGLLKFQLNRKNITGGLKYPKKYGLKMFQSSSSNSWSLW